MNDIEFMKIERQRCCKCKSCWHDDRSPLMCDNLKIELALAQSKSKIIPYCQTILKLQNGKCKYYRFSIIKWLSNIL